MTAQRQATGFHKALLAWYRTHGRHSLPWRNTCDPYLIYVSEIMLQQTQVQTVLDRYYEPFLARFPSLKALSEAGGEQVLSAWQGLGYYRRAKFMHEAARRTNGHMPESIEGLMALPGIGRNTAHAVAAFAYRQPVAVMEANVKRVICRIFAIAEPAEKILWDKAGELLNRKQPFDHNQAMMDLGSMICTPKSPDCAHCPAAGMCRGKGRPEAYPAPKAKRAVPVRRRHIVVQVTKNGKVKATPRRTEFLHGLYRFCELQTRPKAAEKIGEITQAYSHFRLEASIYLECGLPAGNDSYSYSELSQLPMSAAEKKILQLLAPHVKATA